MNTRTESEFNKPAELLRPMTYLRAATEKQHLRLENRLNLLRLDFTLDDYRQILCRFYGFWQPWEILVQKSLGCDWFSFFQERKRSAKLRHDLQKLGLTEAQVSAVPIATRLPCLRSVDAALGSMYVTEGSTLGGQLLSRHFIDHVSVEPEQCTFFEGYGPKTGLMWRRFSEEISKQPQSSVEAMAVAANETFVCLEGWLCQ